MQILVDPYNSELAKEFTSAPEADTEARVLLSDSSDLDAEFIRTPITTWNFDTPGAAARLLRLDPVPSNPVLDRWDVQTHKYGKKTAGKLGFLSNLFSGSGKKVTAGVVHEAKRYRTEKVGDSKTIEIGVSVRLSVATSSLNVKFELSIPNLAAQAQLGMSDAKIGISVVGYFGPIGDLLPAPEDLDVNNFSKFTAAAQEIQKRVFGPDGAQYFSPTLLSFEVEDDGDV